jgi:hypothetical protein
VEALVLVGGWLGRGGGREEEDEGAHGIAAMASRRWVRGDGFAAAASRWQRAAASLFMSFFRSIF